MPYVYPDEIFVEAKFSGDAGPWTRITDVIKGSEYGRWGIMGNGPLDRTAAPGFFEFEVRNDAGNSGGLAGYYTPRHANVRSGWGVGLRVRLGVTFDGFIKYFHGRIPPKGIDVDPNTWGSQRVYVKVKDWLEQAAIHELRLMNYATNYRLNDVATAVVANMDIAPLATEYATGQALFPSAFDTLREGTRALEELAKAVLSEWGYAYVKRDLVQGETLVIENAYSRNSKLTPDVLPIATVASGAMLKEDGGFLLKEDGSKILLDQTETASFVNTMMLDSPEAKHGDQLVNYARGRTYPREVRTNVVLYSLQKPIELGVGEVRDDILVGYRDPTGGNAQVSGINMKTPVASTHYLMNSQEDGLGTDLTANLSVTPSYGTEGVNYRLENTGGQKGYVVKLEAEGDGIFTYDPVDRIAQDAASIAQHGRQEMEIVLKYLENPLQGLAFAQYVVEKLKNPTMQGNALKFLANTDGKHMMAFIMLDVGNRIHAEHGLSGINADFFIQGVEFWVGRGDTLRYRWITKEASDDEYWELGVSALGESTALALV